MVESIGEACDTSTSLKTTLRIGAAVLCTLDNKSSSDTEKFIADLDIRYGMEEKDIADFDNILQAMRNGLVAGSVEELNGLKALSLMPVTGNA